MRAFVKFVYIIFLALLAQLVFIPHPTVADEPKATVHLISDEIEFPLNACAKCMLERTKPDHRVIEASVYSANNENTLFNVVMRTDMTDEERDPFFASYYPTGKKPALKLGNQWYALRTRLATDADPRSRTDYWFETDCMTATRVADSLGVELRLRKHPGYRLQLTATTNKKEYEIGEPVTLQIQLKNVGTVPVTFTYYVYAIDNYKVQLFRNCKPLRSLTVHGYGLHRLKTLQTDETHSATETYGGAEALARIKQHRKTGKFLFHTTDEFAIDEPGEYRFVVTRKDFLVYTKPSRELLYKPENGNARWTESIQVDCEFIIKSQ